MVNGPWIMDLRYRNRPAPSCLTMDRSEYNIRILPIPKEVAMRKVRVNITLDDDLAGFLKGFSLAQRLSMSELINQWALNLKRAQDNQGMETILSAPEFYQSLEDTLERSRSGKMTWHDREKALGNE